MFNYRPQYCLRQSDMYPVRIYIQPSVYCSCPSQAHQYSFRLRVMFFSHLCLSVFLLHYYTYINGIIVHCISQLYVTNKMSKMLKHKSPTSTQVCIIYKFDYFNSTVTALQTLKEQGHYLYNLCQQSNGRHQYVWSHRAI